MKSISMLQLRQQAEKIIAQVRHGKRLLLTYRGKPVATLEPIAEKGAVLADDPFYRLAELAQPGKSLTNRQMDDLIYGR